MRFWRCMAAGVLVLVAYLSCSVPAQTFASPAGRTYELVSPAYKGGFGVTGIFAVPPDGESVAYGSLGTFEGEPSNTVIKNYYIAQRGAGGWSTTPLNAPAAIAPFSNTVDFSTTLKASLSASQVGPSDNRGSGGFDSVVNEYLLHDTGLPDAEANFQVAGMPLERLTQEPFNTVYLGTNADLAHIVFDSEKWLLQEAFGTKSRLYDLASNGEGERPLRLVGLNNKGEALEPDCADRLGYEPGAKQQGFNAVAAGGEEIFFSTNIEVAGKCPSVTAPQLFARMGGSRTLEISRPLEAGGCVGEAFGEVPNEVPCKGASARASAEFQGANEAGTLVFFTSTQALVPGDTDTSNNLYMAKIGCPADEVECETSKKEVVSLVDVSHAGELHVKRVKELADVAGVVAIAPDGSHVYFVAHGVLSEGPNLEDERPIEGADNLYEYNISLGPSSVPVFVADLCSDPGKSGEGLSGVVSDLRCPAEQGVTDASLWTSSGPEAQLNTCVLPSSVECTGEYESGRFLIFSSYAQLVKADTDGTRDVYRYDAVTGVLERVSVGEGGDHENGNDSSFPASIGESHDSGPVFQQSDMGTRAISEDGSRIVFTTAEPLSPGATNGLANAYEWYKGEVSLVSGGSANEPVAETVTSSSGHDIFFTTTQGLLPQDTDGQADVYDARVGGGFPSAPAESRPCSGDACQGPLTNPAPLLVPGSISQQPAGNLAPPKVVASTKQKRIVKKCTKGKKLSHGKCIKSAKKPKAKKSGRVGKNNGR